MRIAVIENKLKDYIVNVFHQHSDSGMELASFLDWNPRQDAYQDIPIGKIEDLYHGQYDAVLIAIKENRYLSRLLTYLHKKHIQNVYVVRLFALDMQEDFLSEARPMKLEGTRVDRMPEGNEKPYLVHLETHVCDHCNLNCKACNNFSPFVKEPSYADIGQFEKDLQRLTELFSGIERFFLLGGEPLLAPELCCDMIRCFRKYFPTDELRVLTNATLILSMKDVFWNCLRENDVIIHISLYPPVKERISKIRQRLEKEEVKYIVFKEVETFAKRWTAYPFEDETYNNEHCGSAGCHYLRNGEISKCPDAILVDFMAEGHAELSGLRLNDRVKLAEETDGWKLIDKIDSPIDMCKKCTYKRLERIKWERVDEEAQPSDWLLPHLYEAEIAELKCAKEKADSEIDNLKRENERAEGEINNLKRENEKANEEIRKLKHETEQLNEKNKNKEKEIELIKKRLSECESRKKDISKKYDDIKELLAKAQSEYDRINSSYSHKIGRLITWLPRKVRNILKKYSGGGVRKFRESGLYKIFHVFHEEILKGYVNYKELCFEYSDRSLFLQFYKGSGDVFLSAMYLKYCELNKKVDKSLLILSNQNSTKVVQLFDLKKCETISIGNENAASLVNIMRFMGFEQIHITNLHYMDSTLLYTSFNVFLSGLNGINFMDLYREIVYQGVNIPILDLTWENDDTWLKSVVKNNQLIKQKTILIAPDAYSVGKKKLPMPFLEKLVDKLKFEGYVVCTNITNKNDKPIQGSKGIFVPYAQLGPFLEYCGYFIGYRSGLCDLIAKVNCRKAVIYPDNIWPRRGGIGSAIEIFSLKAMGLAEDIVEIKYKDEEKAERLIIKKIVKNFREKSDENTCCRGGRCY